MNPYMMSQDPCRHCQWPMVFASPEVPTQPAGTLEICALCGEVSVMGTKVDRDEIPEAAQAELQDVRNNLGVPRASIDEWTSDELVALFRSVPAGPRGVISGVAVQCGQYWVFCMGVGDMRFPLVRFTEEGAGKQIWAEIGKKLDGRPDMMVFVANQVFPQVASRERN